MRIWQWGCPIFTVKIQQSFAFSALWCTSRVSNLCIWFETFQSIKHVDVCRIHGKTNVTWWHGSKQSHRDDHAHNIAWICTYGNRLEHIPTIQGQELSWLERVTHVATRVHLTKCTITHTHASIYIHTSCTMLSHRARKEIDIANVPRVCPSKVQEM